jgi:hypothetical protein
MVTHVFLNVRLPLLGFTEMCAYKIKQQLHFLRVCLFYILRNSSIELKGNNQSAPGPGYKSDGKGSKTQGS